MSEPEKRPTYMAPQDFAHMGESLYGHGWQRILAEQLDYNRVQINRYAVGAEPIPVYIALALAHLHGQLAAGDPPQAKQPVGDIVAGAYIPRRARRATPRP